MKLLSIAENILRFLNRNLKQQIRIFVRDSYFDGINTKQKTLN